MSVMGGSFAIQYIVEYNALIIYIEVITAILCQDMEAHTALSFLLLKSGGGNKNTTN